MRKIICEIADNGSVEVKFIGARLNKRELLRLLRAIRLKYREHVRMARHIMMIELQKRAVENYAKAKAEAEASNNVKDVEKEKLGETSNVSNTITTAETK